MVSGSIGAGSIGSRFKRSRIYWFQVQEEQDLLVPGSRGAGSIGSRFNIDKDILDPGSTRRIFWFRGKDLLVPE